MKSETHLAKRLKKHPTHSDAFGIRLCAARFSAIWIVEALIPALRLGSPMRAFPYGERELKRFYLSLISVLLTMAALLSLSRSGQTREQLH